MGENEGSSDAAQGALPDSDINATSKHIGFFARVIGAFSSSEANIEAPADGSPVIKVMV